MTHKGKCKFCKSTDHNISGCNDESIKNIIDNIEKNIFNKTIYDLEIMDKIFFIIYEKIIYSNEYVSSNFIVQRFMFKYKNIIIDILQNLTKLELSLLAKKNMISTCYPKSIHIDLLTDKYCKICENDSNEFISHLINIYSTSVVIFIYNSPKIKIFLQFIFLIRYVGFNPEEMIKIFYDNLPPNLIDKEYIYIVINSVIDISFEYGFKFTHEDKRHKRRWKINSFISSCIESLDEKELECSICFEDFKEIDLIKTGCNHTFCKTCFEKTIEYILPYKNLSCPLCRQNIENVNVKCVEIHDDFNLKYA
jgi:hypothetical protein